MTAGNRNYSRYLRRRDLYKQRIVEEYLRKTGDVSQDLCTTTELAIYDHKASNVKWHARVMDLKAAKPATETRVEGEVLPH